MAGGFNGILGLTIWRLQAPAAAPTPPPPTPSIPTGGGGNRIGHTGRSGRGHEVLPPGWFDRFDPAELEQLKPRVYRQRGRAADIRNRRSLPKFGSQSVCRVQQTGQVWRAETLLHMAPGVLGTAIAAYHRHYQHNALAIGTRAATITMAVSSVVARRRGHTVALALLAPDGSSTARHRFRDDPQTWAIEWAAEAAAVAAVQATQEAAQAKRRRVCDRQRREDKLLLDDGDLFGL